MTKKEQLESILGELNIYFADKAKIELKRYSENDKQFIENVKTGHQFCGISFSECLVFAKGMRRTFIELYEYFQPKQLHFIRAKLNRTPTGNLSISVKSERFKQSFRISELSDFRDFEKAVLKELIKRGFKVVGWSFNNNNTVYFCSETFKPFRE